MARNTAPAPIAPEAPIEIRPAANGFVVIPARELGRDGVYDPLVFQSMTGLIGFLAGHFSFRNKFVSTDEGEAP